MHPQRRSPGTDQSMLDELALRHRQLLDQAGKVVAGGETVADVENVHFVACVGVGLRFSLSPVGIMSETDLPRRWLIVEHPRGQSAAEMAMRPIVVVVHADEMRTEKGILDAHLQFAYNFITAE